MQRRNTVQRDIICAAVMDMRRHVTAEEVYDYIKSEHPQIGKGTVYRNLNILADEGSVRRVEVPNGPDRYDFTLKNHYHVKCVECGQISDVDADEVTGLIDQIHDFHGMKYLGYDIMFKGICSNCQ